LEGEIDYWAYDVKDAGLLRHPEQKRPVPLPAVGKANRLLTFSSSHPHFWSCPSHSKNSSPRHARPAESYQYHDLLPQLRSRIRAETLSEEGSSSKLSQPLPPPPPRHSEYCLGMRLRSSMDLHSVADPRNYGPPYLDYGKTGSTKFP